MRSVKLKYVADAGLGRVSLAYPNALLGNNSDASVQVREIVGVPDGVDNATLIRLWSRTCDLTWIGGGPARLVFDYAELGEGVIVR